MSTYKISQLRDLFNDWETGIDQAVALLPLFPIDVINDYWSLGWMQNPANPEDRERSDWIRAILMAYSPEGSLPFEARSQDRVRSFYHQKDSWIENKHTLCLASGWSHFSDKIVNTLIKNFRINNLRFYSITLLEKYLNNPEAIIEVEIHIGTIFYDKNKDFAKTLFEKLPKTVEVLELFIEDNSFNFSEDSLLHFKNLKKFIFEGNLLDGVIDFSNNILLEKINIKLNKEEDNLNIKGLNNCLHLNVINVDTESKGNINIEPFDISKLTNLIIFDLSNTTYLGDIKGIIKKEFCLNKYWSRGEKGIIGIKNIDIEINPNLEFDNKNLIIEAIQDLEQVKITGNAYAIELNELSKLKVVNLDLRGDLFEIKLNFLIELETKLQIKANKLNRLTLLNYKNREFPYIDVNEVGENNYDENKDRLIIKIDKSLLESFDGIENIKCDTTLLLNSNNELKKLFKDTSIRCESIKRLVITNSTVTNLDGINQFPNLIGLVLNDLNNLENINGLEYLHKLKTIDLENCSLLSSLEPLANLTNITEIKLSGCIAIKPKPKRLNLSGMQVFEELNRHNKSKPKKKGAASGVSISKIIDFFKAADTDSINQGFMLLSMCNPDELNRLYNTVNYYEKTGKLVFTYLPKSILEDDNTSRLISLLLLFEAPEESLAGQYRNKIEALFLNCDVEVKKAKISLGSEINIDFTPYVNSIGKFSKFKKLKQIQIEEFATFDFIDMAEVPSIVDIHISNIKDILNFDTIAINKNLTDLTIQEKYFHNKAVNNATHLPDINFSSNFSSLDYLKLNLNCNSITGLEHLINCNDLRLIIHMRLEKIIFNNAMRKLEYIYLKGDFCTIENIDQLQKLTKLDISQATLTEPKFLINLLSNEDYLLNKGILENTKFS